MEVLRPGTIPEALDALAVRAGRARILAGGTDLVVRMKEGLEAPGTLVALGRCVELRGVREEGDEVVLGPMTTHEEIARSLFLRRVAPVLCDAAAEVGSLQIRLRGTAGGNIVNASPSADLVPALHVLEAQLVLRSKTAERKLPIELFATGPKATRIALDEILVEIRFPRPSPGEVQLFLKLGSRRALACAKVSLAFRARVDDRVLRGVRIAYGAVAPTVLRVRAAEAALEGVTLAPGVMGRAVVAVEAEITPIDDVRSTAWYRRAACTELLRRAVASTLL
jgi:CO/xanthine dehydrogenase FAD-binding subunit